MTVTNDAIDLKALLYALTQQREPLPEPLQHALQKAGRALQQNQREAADQMLDCVRSYTPLDTAYREALQELDREYASQQRTKNLSAIANSAGIDWFFINDIIPADDWVLIAKQSLQAQQSKPAQGEFWDHADRIAVMIAGGTAIGGSVAYIPGAIIGALIGAGFGGYISFSKRRPSRSS